MSKDSIQLLAIPEISIYLKRGKSCCSYQKQLNKWVDTSWIGHFSNKAGSKKICDEQNVCLRLSNSTISKYNVHYLGRI